MHNNFFKIKIPYCGRTTCSVKHFTLHLIKNLISDFLRGSAGSHTRVSEKLNDFGSQGGGGLQNDYEIITWGGKW